MKSSNNIHKKEYIITKAEYDKLTEAYNKCQEDIINRKYTEEDMIKAFQKGWESREPQHDGGWKTTLTAQDYINSLNKQDNENTI
jgi:hypothetical protein